MSYKIGALILATSKNRNEWVMMQDTYLYKLTLKTFLLTLDKEHNYIFYIGIDKGDRIFDNETQKREITRFSKAFPNVEFKFMTMENMAGTIHTISYSLSLLIPSQRLKKKISKLFIRIKNFISFPKVQ